MPKTVSRISLCVFLIVLFVIGFKYAASIMLPSQSHESIKAYTAIVSGGDFFTFHNAFQIFKQGSNPYDFELFKRSRNKYPIISNSDRFRFMYPPHTLILLAPILSLDIGNAQLLWFSTLIFSLIGVAYFSSISNLKIKFWYIAMTTIFFFPHVSCLREGQVGIVIGLSIAIFLFCIQRNKDFLAGLILIFALMKPHLFIIFGVALSFLCYQSKRYKILLGIFVSSVSFAVFAELICPDIHLYWFNSFRHSFNHGTELLTSSLPSIIRLAGILIFNSNSSLMQFIPSIIVAIALVIYLKKKHAHLNLDLLLMTICVSIVFSPYSWVHDFSILCVVPAFLLSTNNAYSKFIISTSMVIQFLAITSSIIGLDQHWQYFWYPMLITLLPITKISGKNYFKY